ncbi:hypothetical protein G9A89_018236 [Geosiphon pyriformis]|nr:hypothetical protein G9A89_018236 [Geosiphon pyriformis]
MAKTQFIKKLFLPINNFGEATTPSKFEEIIKFIFTSEISMKKTVLLAKEKEIITNVNVKKQRMLSNQTVIIKEIFMDIPKKIIITVVIEFGEIKSIKIQLIRMWQKTVVEFAELTLLFTLPVETTTYNLGIFLDKIGNKHISLIAYLILAIKFTLIFGSVKLSWARLNLVCCRKYEHFSHSVLEYNTPTLTISKFLKTIKRLTKLYAKKSVSISYSAVFGDKFWAQIVSFVFFFDGFHFSSGSGSDDSSINYYLILLECFLELLADQVLSIVKKLSLVNLVPLISVSQSFFFVVITSLSSDLDSNMVLDILQMPLITSLLAVINTSLILDSSSSKILTTKMGSQKSKLVALEASVDFVLLKLDYLYAGLGVNVFAKQKNIVYWHKELGNMRNTSGNCKNSFKGDPKTVSRFQISLWEGVQNIQRQLELKKKLTSQHQEKIFKEETKVATKTPTLTVLEFCHAIYTQNQSNLGLPKGCCPAEFAFTYYINARINYHIGKEEEPHNVKLGLYRELSQYTTKKVAVIAATIVKIHREIEQYTNKNFPIFTKNTREYVHNPEINHEENQQKLGTPAVIVDYLGSQIN